MHKKKKKQKQNTENVMKLNRFYFILVSMYLKKKVVDMKLEWWNKINFNKKKKKESCDIISRRY